MNPSALISKWPGRWTRFLLLSGLAGLGFAQPIVDLLAKNSEFLTVHHLDTWDVVFLVLVLVLGPALILTLLSGLAGMIYRKLERIIFVLGAAVFLSLLCIPLIRHLPPTFDTFAAVVFYLISVLVIWLFISRDTLWPLWKWAGLVPLVVMVLFLVQPGPRSILFPPRMPTALDQDFDQRPDPQIPVILVVFDALPVISLQDQDSIIDPRLYPNLSRFNRDAVWYRNALSLSDNTLLSVPSILTGVKPGTHAHPTRVWHPYNLFSWLEPWREVFAFESHTQLAKATAKMPRRSRWELTASDLSIVFLHLALPPSQTRDLPSITHDWIGFADKDSSPKKGRSFPGRGEIFAEFLESLLHPDHSSVHFLHSIFPHTPYQFLPSGQRYSKGTVEPSGEGKQWGLWSADTVAVVHSQQRHLLQVGYVDRMVGRVLDNLRQSGRYDDALIIFTADHGVSFRPGDTRRKLSLSNGGDILGVPLLVKYPGTGQGGIEDRPVQLIDIIPTIADALGVQPPWPVDGHSLLDSDYPQHHTSPVYGTTADTPTSPFEVSVILQQKQASLAEKLVRFPTLKNDSDLGQPRRQQSLLGQRTPPLLQPLEPWTIFLDGNDQLQVSDQPTALLPAVVKGTLSGGTAFPDHLGIAILVDGRLRAFSRPYRNSEVWSALLAGDFFTPGKHQLGFALVDWQGPEPAFHEVVLQSPSCLDRNLLVETKFHKKSAGLHRLSKWDGVLSSWTDGAADFQIKVPAEDPLRALDFEFLAGSPGDNFLAVVANGQLVGAESREQFPWSGSVDIQDVPKLKKFRATLLSSSHVPSAVKENSRDNRRLGLVLADLHLSEEPQVIPMTTPHHLVLQPGGADHQIWTGLHSTENWDGLPAAWTRAKATCEVNWQGERFPRFLIADVVGTAPHGTRLSIAVNGVEICAEPNINRQWIRLIDLSDVPDSSTFNLTLESSTFVPADIRGGGDHRALGVALRQIILIQ